MDSQVQVGSEFDVIETPYIMPKNHMAICPQCDSRNVNAFGCTTTIMAWSGLYDPNTKNWGCVCNDCGLHFNWNYQFCSRTETNWHWYTVRLLGREEIVKGVAP